MLHIQGDGKPNMLNKTSGNNKRKIDRFELRMFAWLECKAGVARRKIAAFTRDISATGAFFLTDDSIAVGETVHAMVLLSRDSKSAADKNGSAMSFAGRVVRAEDLGIAVCFTKNGQLMSL